MMMTTNSTGLYVEATTLSEAIEVEIERLRPLTDTPTSYTMVLCAVLLVSLIFGIGGNASLFGLIVYVRKWVDRAPPEQTSPPPANFTTPCIMLLCLVNLAISVSVAPVIVDYLVGLWLLGEGVCTFYKTVTAGGNIMANFAVAGIAYDRFAAVSAYSWKVPPRRRPCSVLWWLIGLLLITALLATPTFMYSEVEVVTLSHTIEQPGFETFVQINKCYEMLPKSIFYWSVFGNVLIGFLLPLTMTAYFILRLVCALYCFTKETEQNRRMLAERRVALWAIVVSLLHFVCCLPHWSFSVYANIAFSGLHTEAAPSQALIQFFGVFRFLSSALSWIPAGLLNDRLEMLEICDGGGDRPNMQQQQSYELAEIRLPLRRTTVFFTYRQHSQTSSYQSAVSFPFTQLNGDTYE